MSTSWFAILFAFCSECLYMLGHYMILNKGWSLQYTPYFRAVTGITTWSS